MTSEVHVVDDDPAIRDSLYWLLQSRGVPSRTWATPREFLDQAGPGLRGCALLDVRMPGINGIELFDRLRAVGCRVPVIYLTGHGDVPMAVQAIKNGAFDFLEKPYNDNALVDKVLLALACDAERRTEEDANAALTRNLTLLTVREQEVMQRILAGKMNKIIANELGIAMRTVEVHRARIFEKMEVRSAVELSQRLGRLDGKPMA